MQTTPVLPQFVDACAALNELDNFLRINIEYAASESVVDSQEVPPHHIHVPILTWLHTHVCDEQPLYVYLKNSMSCCIDY